MDDPPIEFHESEYYESLVDDETLRIVLLLCGQEVKDKLAEIDAGLKDGSITTGYGQ